MALTKEGFKRETYEDILARTEAQAKIQFGEDTNTSARSALGMLLRVWAFLIAMVWQEIEHVFYSSYRKTAYGAQLDALMPYSGIEREPATHASGPVQITGTAGTTVPMGFVVAKENETLYYTLDDTVIGADGTVLVEIMADEPGIGGNAEIGQINQIFNPVDGVTAVTNLVPFTNGQDAESDAELKARADLATEGQGSGTTESIRTELLKIPDVRAAFVDENYGDTVNEYGTPLGAVQAFVLGGTDDEIVQAIHRKRSGGIRPHGEQSAPVKDASGKTKNIGFTRAHIINISARLQLTTNTTFEANGLEQVKTAIVQYIGGLDANGAVYNGLNMGDDVILSKLIAQIYRVNGIEDVHVELSTDGNIFTAANITVALQEVARITAGDIEVM